MKIFILFYLLLSLSWSLEGSRRFCILLFDVFDSCSEIGFLFSSSYERVIYCESAANKAEWAYYKYTFNEKEAKKLGEMCYNICLNPEGYIKLRKSWFDNCIKR